MLRLSAPLEVCERKQRGLGPQDSQQSAAAPFFASSLIKSDPHAGICREPRSLLHPSRRCKLSELLQKPPHNCARGHTLTLRCQYKRTAQSPNAVSRLRASDARLRSSRGSGAKEEPPPFPTHSVYKIIIVRNEGGSEDRGGASTRACGYADDPTQPAEA